MIDGTKKKFGLCACCRYAPASRLRYSNEVAVPALLADFGRKLHLIGVDTLLVLFLFFFFFAFAVPSIT